MRAGEQCSSGLFTGNLTAVCERICIHQHSTPQHLQLAGTGGMCECGCVFLQLSRTLAFNLHKGPSEQHLNPSLCDRYLMIRFEKSRLQLLCV